MSSSDENVVAMQKIANDILKLMATLSVGPLGERDVQSSQERIVFIQGYMQAAWNYAIWHDGEQICGTHTPYTLIREACTYLIDVYEKAIARLREEEFHAYTEDDDG